MFRAVYDYSLASYYSKYAPQPLFDVTFSVYLNHELKTMESL